MWWRKMVPGPSKAVGPEKLIAEMVWSLPGRSATREIREQIQTSRVKFSNLHHLAGAFWIWFWMCPRRIYIHGCSHPWNRTGQEGWFHAATVFHWLHIPNWSTQTEFTAQPRISHFTSDWKLSVLQPGLKLEKMYKPDIKILLHAWANWEDPGYIFRHCPCSKF